MLETITRASFEAYLNQTFTAEVGEAEVALELTDVTPLSEGARIPEGREPFSVLFLAKGGEILPQAIYTLRHPKAGELSLFLVPLGPDVEKKGIRHEAIFT
jgi:hypothetical protein